MVSDERVEAIRRTSGGQGAGRRERVDAIEGAGRAERAGRTGRAEGGERRGTAERRERRRMRPWLSAAAATLGAIALLPAGANAVTLTFDDLGLVHGEVVSAFDGVTIEATNYNRSHDLAVVFDSELTGTSDKDLESASGGGTRWSGGNLLGEDLGLMLILQENDQGCNSGVCRDPDDEGFRAAGELRFVFDVPVSSFGFDLVDVENTTIENGAIRFEGSSGGSVSIDFASFLGGYELGNNTANRIDAFTAASVGLPDELFTEVVITLGGSGALDNVNFQPVPEPGTALTLGLGVAWLAHRRRRHVVH